MADNVRDILRGLLKQSGTKEKKPFTLPDPPPVAARPEPQEERPKQQKRKPAAAPPAGGLLQRMETYNRAPLQSGRDISYVDHTIEIDGKLSAAWLVRAFGVDLGYIWCTQDCWKWRTKDAANFGDRTSKKAAAQVLLDIHNSKR